MQQQMLHMLFEQGGKPTCRVLPLLYQGRMAICSAMRRRMPCTSMHLRFYCDKAPSPGTHAYMPAPHQKTYLLACTHRYQQCTILCMYHKTQAGRQADISIHTGRQVQHGSQSPSMSMCIAADYTYYTHPLKQAAWSACI